LSNTKPLLDDLDESNLTILLEAAADLALIVDKAGKITHVSGASTDFESEIGALLVGQQLVDTVVDDSREKAEELLAVSDRSATVVRDLSHRLPDGREIPVRYGAAPVFRDGRIAILGRDMRAIAALQQQVLDAQKALEQDYWKLRHVETRYRLLFQSANEPLLIIDEASRRILEANPLADKHLSSGKRSIVGKAFPIGFDTEGADALRNLLLEAGAVGRATLPAVHSADGTEEFRVSATLLRQGNEARYLIRLSYAGSARNAHAGESTGCIESVMRHAPDAVVLTDTDGRIRSVNQTFLDMAQLASEEQVAGRSIDHWLGRSAVDLNVLLNNLREHESVRLFATKLRSEFGTTTDVEISVGPYEDSDEAGFAFFIRDVSRRLSGESGNRPELPRSVEQITQQVGRVPLKDLVRQSTDLVERLCIETALELTGDNRASAAELLGVSRQGLYAKLNRYHLGEKGAED
jgi:transcriptional regulator PpsR